MENFKAVYRIGTLKPWEGAPRVGYYVAAEYKDGKLSLQGVEGPKDSGNCIGSCGQARDGLTDASLAPGEGWTHAMAARLAEIWESWHLNDMSAADPAMIASGWNEIAKTPAFGWHFSLSSESWAKRREVERESLESLGKANAVQLSESDAALIRAPLSYVEWTLEGEAEPMARPLYARATDLKGGVKPAERKTLGWVRESDHPQGLLGKVHPESGNAYGTAWYKLEVPESVLAELRAFPLYAKPLHWFAWTGAAVESAILAAYGERASALGFGERSEATRAWQYGDTARTASASEAERLESYFKAGTPAHKVFLAGKGVE